MIIFVACDIISAKLAGYDHWVQQVRHFLDTCGHTNAKGIWGNIFLELEITGNFNIFFFYSLLCNSGLYITSINIFSESKGLTS